MEAGETAAVVRAEEAEATAEAEAAATARAVDWAKAAAAEAVRAAGVGGTVEEEMAEEAEETAAVAREAAETVAAVRVAVVAVSAVEFDRNQSRAVYCRRSLLWGGGSRPRARRCTAPSCCARTWP
jgi:hypothetical protein